MAIEFGSLGVYVGELINSTSFVGGLLVSFLFLLMVILSVSRFTKNGTVMVISGVMAVLLCAGLGWLPTWIPLVIVLIVAVQYGNLAQRIMGGS